MVASTRQDIQSNVTASIVSMLEKGVRPWSCPWSGDNLSIPLRHEGTPYRGINVIVLWMAAQAKGYSSATWMTYRQCQELGGHVRQGEKSTGVVYCGKIEDEEENRDIFFMKSYAVFNVEQCDGLPASYCQLIARPEPKERIATAEAFVARTQATIEHGGIRAYYSIINDRIQLPPFEAFKDAEAYYGTAAHELSHWSGAKHRLNREQTGDKRSDAYYREEIIAELSASFLCGELGIENEVRPDHADYIGHYLNLLRTDKTAIFKAAAQAQKSVDYLKSL